MRVIAAAIGAATPWALTSCAEPGSVPQTSPPLEVSEIIVSDRRVAEGQYNGKTRWRPGPPTSNIYVRKGNIVFIYAYVSNIMIDSVHSYYWKIFMPDGSLSRYSKKATIKSKDTAWNIYRTIHLDPEFEHPTGKWSIRLELDDEPRRNSYFTILNFEDLSNISKTMSYDERIEYFRLLCSADPTIASYAEKRDLRVQQFCSCFADGIGTISEDGQKIMVKITRDDGAVDKLIANDQRLLLAYYEKNCYDVLDFIRECRKERGSCE